MDNKDDKKEKKKYDLKSYGIFIVIACCTVCYLVGYTVINDNLVEYSELSDSFSISVPAKNKRDRTILTFERKKEIPDTLSQQAFTLKTKTVEDTTLLPKLSATASAGISAPFKLVKQPIPGDHYHLRHYLFHANPMFMVWVVLVLIMITVAGGCFAAYLFQAFDLAYKYTLGWKTLANAFLFLAIIALFLTMSNADLVGYNRAQDVINEFGVLLSGGWVLTFIITFTLCLISPLLYYMFLIGLACDNVLPENDTREEVEESVTKLENLNTMLRNTFRVLSCVVAFSVITSSAFRVSLKKAINLDDRVFDVFPSDASLVYGLYFSLFLGIMYVPIYLYLKRNYGILKQKAEHLQSSMDDKEWAAKQAGKMNFNLTLTDNFKLAIMMLSPFITSLLPQQMHDLFN
ncbi:MAG TPA: hypothetical protein VK177_13490 [Flavobacteriales bacterium]|nr:hypothetical protein [Flavobacteriales bacterium]